MEDFCLLLMLPNGKPFHKEQVLIEIKSCHNRESAPNMNLEDKIESTWHDRLLCEHNLWNGTKFRYAGHLLTCSNNELCLKLGITDYKTFIGSNASSDVTEFQTLGLATHNNSQIYLSDPLGVGAIVGTRDAKIILIRRSMHVGEAKGMVDVPGGHPEPKELVGYKSKEEIKFNDLSSNNVREELFSSVVHEIKNEINIPLECLSEPMFMGIIGNLQSGKRPVAEFYIKSCLSSDEVKERYKEGTQTEADESTDILFIPKSDLQNVEQLPIYAHLTPSAKGAIKLFLDLKISV